jgi:hypothetical protein
VSPSLKPSLSLQSVLTVSPSGKLHGGVHSSHSVNGATGTVGQSRGLPIPIQPSGGCSPSIRLCSSMAARCKLHAHRVESQSGLSEGLDKLAAPPGGPLSGASLSLGNNTSGGALSAMRRTLVARPNLGSTARGGESDQPKPVASRHRHEVMSSWFRWRA